MWVVFVFVFCSLTLELMGKLETSLEWSFKELQHLSFSSYWKQNVVDLVSRIWDEMYVLCSHQQTEFRFFWLQSKVQETEGMSEIAKRNPVSPLQDLPTFFLFFFRHLSVKSNDLLILLVGDFCQIWVKTAFFTNTVLLCWFVWANSSASWVYKVLNARRHPFKRFWLQNTASV